MDWHAFEVDGETFYWTAYPSKTGTADGAWVDDENLSISRAPNTQGIGRSYPADTIISVEDAIDTVRLFKEHGHLVP